MPDLLGHFSRRITSKDSKMTQVKTMNTLVKGLQLAAVSAIILAASPSYGAIIGGTSTVTTRGGSFVGTFDFKKLDPAPSVLEANNTETESQTIQGFDEKQNFILDQDFFVTDGFNEPNRSNSTVLIPTGTLVSSHFLFVDKPGQQRHIWSGEVTFDQEIIGVIASRGAYTNDAVSTRLFGLETTSYNLSSGRGLDTSGKYPELNDIVSFDGNVLSFTISAAARTLDPLRVITHGSQVKSVPEPLTLLGTGTALGFIPLLKRTYAKKHKNNKKK
ncbi:MAG: PEP-CTERM sorting domain-containing protein [Coleofasciculus sp. D1-CHI-01]|uniref:PEP-CTERM sorting domain-containing protein n=1 Tax=Coleofasciculus sp. D1-CHI-01 TaxID=3068482 RepID=UPI0032F78867